MNKRLSLFYSLFFCFVTLPFSSVSQGIEEQLAQQHFQKKEFDKAIIYYEKLYNKNPSTFYQVYINCLIETRDQKTAEKIIKKNIKAFPKILSYRVDLGNLYRSFSEEERAKKEFETAIKNLPNDQIEIIALAKAFASLKDWDYAIATYLKGKRLMQGIYSFNFELAEMYEAKGDLTSMINEYLDLLEISETYIQTVQNALQTSFGIEGDNTKNEILKTELIKRVQKNDSPVFSELLIWMLIQQRDFENAFIQSKALDKRKKEEGDRLIGLGDICVSNELYDIAQKCYEYVIEKGKAAPYYTIARLQLVDVIYKKVIENSSSSSNDILRLKEVIIQTLHELGKNPGTIVLLKKLAHIQAFYLHDNEDAIAILNEAINVPRINSITQAECKLELGDILLLSGDIWEASLIYSQVEKAFKQDAVGQDAKFRNARISYYTGDFKWAQAQLDVLKASTSKLIANDAMFLSLIISDNTAIDTNSIPLYFYARADLLSFQNKDSLSLHLLDSISFVFPLHAINDDILYKKAAIAIKAKNYSLACKYYEKIILEHSYEILADDALFQLADINEKKLFDKEMAMKYFEEIITKHPGSLYIVEARKRYRSLRGDSIN